MSYSISFQPPARRLPGYSLIELLIVVSITALLITFGVNAYRKSSDIQSVKSQTELILSALIQAQKAATTGKTDCSSRYLGERVQTTANQSTLTVTSVCASGLGTPRSFNLSEMTFVSTTSFTFRPLNLGVDLGAADPLNLDYQKSGSTYRIEISKSGSIKNIGKL